MTDTVDAPVAAQHGTRHRFDYYYEPGMPLRPPPPRLQRDPAWANRPVFDAVRPTKPTGRQQDLLDLFKDHRSLPWSV